MTRGTTMTRSEGSVTFSLGELMKLEDERVAGEAQERAANDRAAAAAQAEAARQARADEEARMRAGVDAEERRRRAELDEVARREAMQKALVEQARLEVETRTRTNERERERAHEIALQNARTATPKPASLGSLIAATGLGGGLVLLVTCILHFGVTQPVNERRFAELELRATTAEQKASDAQADGNRAKRTIASLEQRNATLEADNKVLRTAPPPAVTTKPPPGSHPVPKTQKADEPKCADPHDPMCFSIGR